LHQYIDLLLKAIDNERTYKEDEFQAQVCLGWIHWQMGELSLAVNKLPRGIEQDYSQLDGTSGETSEWTKICALKASYLKGSSQERTGAVAEALETFESALPVFASASNSPKQGKELRAWTELYLTGFCMLSSHVVKSKISSILETETLSAFRSWAKFWDVQAAAPTGGRAIDANVSRRQVWKEYYITLSDLLQQELPFSTTALTTAYAETSTKLQQRAELKRVEARYETLLLSEVQFPKATEASAEVEAFVDIVMQNWRILCGSSWEETDLGEGGSEAVSRGVLDILYRAATKTFHSTAILRHLFTVHLAVAEFDLAFKAFDTYLDIVKKGKARVEKTGEAELGLDDDEIVLKTASECIKALCRYGSRQGTEKAKDLGHFFEDWLEKHRPSGAPRENGHPGENGHATPTATNIAPKVFALAWRCIGISHAQWSRLTYDAPSRSEIQLKAIKCFRKALAPEYESTRDVETLFPLGMVLAERRELPAAIEVVKSGLMPHSSSNHMNGSGPHPGRFARERSLISLWHLMALLLSSRQEFTTAARSCEGAFEQFKDPKYLFGEADLQGSFRSAHLNEKALSHHQGVVDQMDDFEKHGVLEVKMTQLALIEVLEGPEVAVNASDELLSLYARLFGDPRKEPANSGIANNTLTRPPKSSAGTIRSIGGSLFGRTGRSSVRKTQLGGSTIDEEKSVSTLRPQTTQTVASVRAPTIHVTNENGNAAGRKSSGPHHHEKLQKRSDSLSRKNGPGSLRKKRSVSTGRKRSSSEGNTVQSNEPTTVDGEKFFTAPLDSSGHDGSSGNSSQFTTVSRPLPPKSQQMNHKEKSLKPAHPNPALAQDNRLLHVSPFISSTNPVTRFPKDQQRRRRTTILVKVWLLISGFYRRASLYDDCKGAITEAENLVRTVENDITRDITGNVSSDHAGWAGGKSVGELWADVLAEVGASNSLLC
jgi:tetratricopeptide (TPR) repeat protein